eukprot:s42_g38.t1
MQVKRIANKITKSYLMDPYAMMMHYKRAFKLLDVMKQNSAKVLILGNKNQFGISWKGRFEGVEFDTGVVDEKLISSAPKHYEMILCLDPVLYCRSLRKINLPVMMCATLREITEHPEILDVTDYLLPSPTRRHDAALRAMVGLDILGEAPQGTDAALPSAEAASAPSTSTSSTSTSSGRLIEQGEAPQGTDAASPSAEAASAPPTSTSSTSTLSGRLIEQGAPKVEPPTEKPREE